ncbi:filamentous hemagglutinin N-terminal domain-containing protein, partial [Rhodospirillum sp. A1_3_36]|uniref:filamentous hemagglutinin N-terminal domain-containing protein n=1 Tax=Rhodospirillum sp. A1_3_36 TaxID=3391666 RepID=UPI0039A6AF4D
MAAIVSSAERAYWEQGVVRPKWKQAWIRRLTGALTLGVFLFQQVAPSIAGSIEVDGNPSSTSSATLTIAPNNVPVVNIARPDASGLSHNKFRDFNVDGRGVVLNNKSKDAQSKLAGLIAGNPKLQGRSASTILGEVTGANRSVLEGYTEVHGAAANWILANPNGITCNGCGFINIPRATLSTGRPGVTSQGLESLSVEGGTVVIGPGGLDATETSAIDIIARAAEINGAIQGGDQTELRIIAGRNNVDYNSLQASALSDAGGKPAFGIDSSALGGMYAGRITLVGTEGGVGVRLPDNVQATTGALSLTADGRIIVNNTQSVGNTTITSTHGDVDFFGGTRPQGELSISAAGTTTVKSGAVVGAPDSVRINTGTLAVEAGTLAAGLEAGGGLSQGR